MIVALLTGAGVGLGVLAVVRGLRPPRPPLAVLLARHQPAVAAPDPPAPTSSDPTPARPGRLAVRAGRLLARLAAALGLRFGGTRRDLAVTGQSLERHLAEKAGMALFGLLLAPAATAALALGGVTLPVGVPLWAALALVAGGFSCPTLGCGPMPLAGGVSCAMRWAPCWT